MVIPKGNVRKKIIWLFQLPRKSLVCLPSLSPPARLWYHLLAGALVLPALASPQLHPKGSVYSSRALPEHMPSLMGHPCWRVWAHGRSFRGQREAQGGFLWGLEESSPGRAPSSLQCLAWLPWSSLMCQASLDWWYKRSCGEAIFLPLFYFFFSWKK